MFHANDVVVINDKDKDNDIRLWCEVCGIVVYEYQDINKMRESSCCEECWLTFGESKRLKWLNGWRPDHETLSRYKLERRILNVKLQSIIGDIK
jgi:hypothetical protein